MEKEKLWWRSRGLDRMEERFGNKIAKFISGRVKEKNKKNGKIRVLEIGFGEGKCLLELQELFPEVEFYGLNKKKEGEMYKQSDFVKNAKRFDVKIGKKLPKPYFYNAEDGLKFKPNFFDLVISQVVIPYIGDKAKLYEEIWKVLKKDGKAFLHIDRTRIPALPTFLRVKTETPLCIIYHKGKIIQLKRIINRVRKNGFDIKITWSLPEKKQRNLVMRKNVMKPLKLGLTYDGVSTLYLTPLKNTDPHKKQPGIWWGTRSVFHA